MDLLILPNDKLPRGRRFYKYPLTVVDIASWKHSAEVAKAFQLIYKQSPFTWRQVLQVDPDHKFMGSVTKEMENHKIFIHRGRTEIHRDQSIVECFDRMLAERLLGHQFSVKILLPGGSGRLHGSRGFPMFLPLSTMR